ncbi:MAG TPA: DUF2877 domain-containing protein [Anaerolineales bacterium]|nr:DUF2877 domain-containing protein [Anaerolineales bacterium]
MQLHAASIGEAVPRENFDAVIQSVFESAVNLRLAGEDRLITLLISESYELPQGIRVTDKNFPLQSLIVDLHAASRGGILRFESSPLTVDLRGAPIWKCPIPELGADMGSPPVQKAWSIAWELLNLQQGLRKTDILADDLFQINTGSSLSRRMSKPVMGLVASTEQFDTDNAIRAAEKMIGLGPGVTPSGDDILIGFLAGLWSTAGQDQRQSLFIRSFGAELVQRARQTSEISRTYIFHAAQGQFSSSLSHLVESITAGDEVEEAAQTAMRVGHSSGMDSVTGLLIGLCVWNSALGGVLAAEDGGGIISKTALTPTLYPFGHTSQRERGNQDGA